ncbi:MAG: TonB-dependent receptor [Hyphomonadaceae bacterium]|nr:TonB-dependent receptor [Hyphomonadaceae bacterium]
MKAGETRAIFSGLAMLAGLAAAVTPAVAQERSEEDEVIVTAQRRAESIQDVPLSITALGAETIERSGFQELDDYAQRVPNLAFSASNSSSTDGALSIAIRGVFGSNTTGFYIDDSPLLGALNPRVMDLQRIEVLRGPQGTLYGARSMGGTVRMITVAPDVTEFSGRAHALGSSTQDGGFNYGVDGALNIPVVEGVFGVRAVGYYQENAGFIDRAARGDAPTPFSSREDIDSEAAQGFQLSGLLSLMNGDLTITPRIMHERVERDGRTQADFTAGNRVNLRQFDIAEPSESEWTLSTLTANYDAGFGSFVSASSWFDRTFSDTEDFSEWTTAVLAFQGASIARAETDQFIFSQELRFVSDWEGPLSLTAGVFYQSSKSDWVFPVGGTTVDGFSTDAFNLNNPTTVTEQAAFAEVTWNVNDDLRFIVGARAFENDVDFYIRQGGDFIGPDQITQGTQSENGVTPRFGVQYDLDDERMLYATVSEGFRVGGVNFYADSLCAAEIASLGLGDVATFDSDSLRSYEVGLKSRWLDRRLTLNAAAFQVDWSDLQQRQGLACGFTVNVNAGEAQLRGLELEMDWLLGEGTRVNVGVGYVDSEITDNGGLSTVIEGAPVQNVPEWTWSVALDQDFNVAGHDAYLHADYGFTDSSYSGNNSPTTPLLRPSYAIANLRIGASFGVGELALFADNVFDEAANYADIPPLGVQTPGRPRIVVNQPRTIGLEWRRNF